MIKLKAFSDPMYGSETALTFEPEWVAEVEDKFRTLFPLRKYPATFIKLKNGKHYWAQGHHAEEIKAAQAEAQAQET